MAIQFACPACQQPIEVDDEWANQTVSCPYCRRVVRAPGQSTFQLSGVPAASQSGAAAYGTPNGAFGTVPPPPPEGYAPIGSDRATPAAVSLRGARPNSLGAWSVICGLLAIGLMIGAVTVVTPVIRSVLAPIATTLPATRALTPQESQAVKQQAQARLEQLVMNDPAIQKRAGGAMLLWVGSEVLALTGLILGIVGSARPNVRKRGAVAGIIICAAFLAGQCGVFAMMLVSTA